MNGYNPKKIAKLGDSSCNTRGVGGGVVYILKYEIGIYVPHRV